MYNPNTKRTIINRDVKFLENEERIWSENIQQEQQLETKDFYEDHAPTKSPSNNSTNSHSMGKHLDLLQDLNQHLDIT